MTDVVHIEADLYEPTRHFVGGRFLRELCERTSTSGLQMFVEDTSTAGGSDSGYWSKPDVSALVLGRGRFVPRWATELHTFEVKTAAGLSESSVHEANAHGRFGQFTWLVFQAVGKASADTALVRKVIKLAYQMGVGIVHFDEPTTPRSWSIHHWPRHTGADFAASDLFIRDRFSPTLKARIASHLAILGWPGIPNED